MGINATVTRGRQAVLLAAVAAVLGMWGSWAGAQSLNPEVITTSSQSGQFVVYAGHSTALPRSVANLATNQNFVRLEPTLATVSCERIKQALAHELGDTDPWHGHIYVVLYPARSASDTITITSERFKGGWQYRVDFPDMVERPRYVRAVVQVLLLELANRAAPARPAEIPFWLVEGFSQLLLASSEVEIILPPPREKVNGLSLTSVRISERKEGLREQARKKLRGRPALTFEELSWPTDSELAGDADGLYSGSAQLFVGELLRLPDGPACLRAMLAQLPRNYNWQFAFLGAFHAFFERPLDVEKWWALFLAGTTGRNPAQTWSPAESWQRLDQAIHTGAQVRTGANELPMHADLKLQTVLRDWDSVRQTQALRGALRELALLRPRIAQEFVGLVQDYSQTIQTYLQQRDHTGGILPFTRKAARRRVVEAAIRQLDALDARRNALRPIPASDATNPPPALPAPAP